MICNFPTVFCGIIACGMTSAAGSRAGRCWGNMFRGGNCTSVDFQGASAVYSTSSAFMVLTKNTASGQCWGSDTYADQCANQDFTGVTKIFSNAYSFFALDTNSGRGQCWGTSLYGGDCKGRTFEGVNDVYNTWWAFLALNRNNGSAQCWGESQFGGNCDGVDFQDVASVYSNSRAFVAITASSGSPVCWGEPTYGGDCSHFEMMNITDVFSTHYAFMALDRVAGVARCWGVRGFGGDCSSQNFLNVRDVYSSGHAFVALNETGGGAQCWGSTELGGSCTHIDFQDITNIYSTWFAFLAINTLIGTGQCWGHAAYGGECSTIDFSDVTAVYSTQNAFAAVIDGGVGDSKATVRCWGGEDNGGFCSGVELGTTPKVYSNPHAFVAIWESESSLGSGRVATPAYTTASLRQTMSISTSTSPPFSPTSRSTASATMAAGTFTAMMDTAASTGTTHFAVLTSAPSSTFTDVELSGNTGFAPRSVPESGNGTTQGSFLTSASSISILPMPPTSSPRAATSPSHANSSTLLGADATSTSATLASLASTVVQSQASSTTTARRHVPARREGQSSQAEDELIATGGIPNNTTDNGVHNEAAIKVANRTFKTTTPISASTTQSVASLASVGSFVQPSETALDDLSLDCGYEAMCVSQMRMYVGIAALVILGGLTLSSTALWCRSIEQSRKQRVTLVGELRRSQTAAQAVHEEREKLSKEVDQSQEVNDGLKRLSEIRARELECRQEEVASWKTAAEEARRERDVARSGSTLGFSDQLAARMAAVQEVRREYDEATQEITVQLQAAAAAWENTAMEARRERDDTKKEVERLRAQLRDQEEKMEQKERQEREARRQDERRQRRERRPCTNETPRIAVSDQNCLLAEVEESVEALRNIPLQERSQGFRALKRSYHPDAQRVKSAAVQRLFTELSQHVNSFCEAHLQKDCAACERD
eukprot:TRINITY_DN29239_c0_g1_i1.p1 TRINITY_DN29239_c0_g1~~TRINITY_DN29239_c0_g1_i1.p1  ORF type:complete len:943 (+),score=157.75 TRINITY_DN29239_c0_g1_i1:176-3004(+)